MIGLARMAWRLACIRDGEWASRSWLFNPPESGCRTHPSSRDETEAYSLTVSREYYRIIDRITRGEKP